MSSFGDRSSSGDSNFPPDPPVGLVTDYSLPDELETEGPPAVILATAGYDHTIRFWDVVRGVCIGTLQHNEDKLFIAAGGNPAIRLYDTIAATRPTEEGTVNTTANIPPLHVFEGHTGNVVAVGFAADGRWMWSASEDGMLRVWELSPPDYACQREISLGAPITAAALHPNGMDIYIIDAEGWLRVWDLAANSCVREYLVEEGVPLRWLCLSPDHRHISIVDHHGRLHLWRIYSNIESAVSVEESATSLFGVQLYRICTVSAHDTYALKCLFSPDSSCVLSTSADGTAKLWRIMEMGAESSGSSPDRASLSDFSTSPINVNLVLAQVFTGHSKWVWDAAFSADSAYVVTASSDNTARLWDVQTAEAIVVYASHSKAVICVALNDLPTV